MDFHPNKAFYDRIAHVYDAIAHASEAEATNRGLRLLDLQPGETALEIGFGTGHALVAMAEAVGESGQVSGLDVSDGMREVAAHRLQKAGLDSRVRLEVGSCPPLRQDDDSLDAVFLSFTLELFPETVLEENLAEIRRVLKPGGRIGVVSMAAPESDPERTFAEGGYVWMHRHFPHIVDCRPIPARRQIEQAGFVNPVEERMEMWGLAVSMLRADAPAGA